MLYIVPTPIGNLEDFSFRSIRILKEVSLILVESYKISNKLLKFYNIKTNLIKYHIHNEHKIIPFITKKIKEGKNIALISNAGTPGISDPGYLLIRRCIELSIYVDCLPGATALIPSLVISGIPINEFIFIGFLPKKKRNIKLENLSKENRTIVLYESPYRLLKTLNDIKIFFGIKTYVVLCKEISKIHQNTVRGNIKDVLSFYKDKKKNILGEYTIVIKTNN
ncbi:16S rRNA (cytidine(1402)-2'-O)-methyltransferase [Blattabacterium cuenoti]|uniref:16S rRNA (cytidine(1402)-2'-O)-methyltransferase n=1 Tax=Blattabacterium cuenoti TaxID=1653831 RepID=UPI00163CA6DF|nr:16S rRNA (cytidine(1402)-2'-O)-methyltransferase [Blattabacterium cuenoti]